MSAALYKTAILKAVIPNNVTVFGGGGGGLKMQSPEKSKLLKTYTIVCSILKLPIFLGYYELKI